MNKKILVPYDGSEMSDKALNHALEIAEAMNMKIIVLRVLAGFIDSSKLLFLNPVDRKNIKKQLAKTDKKAEEQHYRKLNKQLAICTSKDVQASSMVVHGDPSNMILSVADKEKPYMIVMGSKKLKGFAKLKMLGSVSRTVVENAKCPVTIVH
ncbi:MAG: universal stress protein [Nitrososphaerales archaeon]